MLHLWYMVWIGSICSCWAEIRHGVSACPLVFCDLIGRIYYRTAGNEVKLACQYLLSRQMEDGGWGEEFAVS